MELLLGACSGTGEVASVFVQTTWASIIDRLRAEELTASASDSARKQEEPESEPGYDDEGWEEKKGDDAEAQRAEKTNKSPRKQCGVGMRAGVAAGGTDVALAASSDSQLRVAGTFFRAIRISVRAGRGSDLARWGL